MTLPPGRELLDDPAADPVAVRESLHHIVASNRWFGGAAALRWGIARALAADPPTGPLTLLDLGTGAGDLPIGIAQWAARRGVVIRPLGLERIPAAATLARDNGVPTILACVRALPVRAGGVDLVTISQLLHHLSRDEAVALLRAATRIARRAVVAADLRRSGVARAAFRLGATVFRFDPHTRADGLTSIARGYLPAEWRALCGAAGGPVETAELPGWRVAAWWPARGATP
jgi:hypothetical protein